MTIYVVQGVARDYPEDARVWDVKAFSDEEKANVIQSRLNDWCKAQGLHPDSPEPRTWDFKSKPDRTLDPNPDFPTPMSDAEYRVRPLEFEGFSS